MNKNNIHPKIQAWLNLVDQGVYAVSQTFIKLLPLILPLPMVGMVGYDLYTFVLPFPDERIKGILAAIAAVGLEFFGASALDVAREAKAYEVGQDGKKNPAISPMWGYAGLWTYVLTAFAIITVTGVAPKFSISDSATYPYLMQYAFVILIPFGYQFLMVNAAIKRDEQKRREQRTDQAQAKDDDLRRQAQAAEIAKVEAEAAQMQAEAEARQKLAEAEADARRKNAEARLVKAEKYTPRSVLATTKLPPVLESDVNWRQGTFEEIDGALAAELKPPALNPTELRRLQTLAEQLNSNWFGKPEAAAALDVREGMTLQLLKICYAHGLIARGQNGQYRLEKSGEVLAWLRGEKIEV